MTGGASGGGWVVHRNGRSLVASVSSYIYEDDQESLYGPYQGSVAQNLYSQARSG
jgi:hypothetical protein